MAAHLHLHLRAMTMASIAGSPSLRDVVNDLCRVLSDRRAAHHELEPALLPFLPHLSSDLVDHVLRRCRNLPIPSHRFYLWAIRHPSFRPSPISLPILASSLLSSRLYPLLWSLLSELPHPPDPKIFHLFFRSYARDGLASDAIRAFSNMPRFGLSPTLHDLHLLFLSLCRFKLVSDAQAFFDKVKPDFSVTQKTYSILMNGWATVEDSEMAVKLFDEMRNRGLHVDVAACNTLMAALCKGKRVSEAYDRLLEMQKVYGLEPDAASYAVFIRASCDAKDLSSTVKLLDRMKRYNLAPNVYTYNCVVRLFCEMEKIDEAYVLLDEMCERGVKPDVWSYNAVLAVHCKLKEVNKALRLLLRMDRDSCLPERHTYNLLLKMLISVGRIDRAIEVWDGMEKRGFYPAAPSYSVMIHGLCRKKGSIEEACKYFEMMVEEGIPPYHSTCELLKDQLLHLGLKERLDILFDKMQRSTSCSIQELSSAMDRRRKNTDRSQKEIGEGTL
ncbi:hypothetical protein J5N97_020047 [Dioscorea zingiberensis]|uniref:Pentatricopeptide repeat-containing protein n=1 Tax=Dioscorea zingiberensis TaxID=325984 RepID=A0A9D5CF58_9LILI|nr:hypothetical protein J5N97_020047 [Dioscorea zingiberensis]